MVPGIVGKDGLIPVHVWVGLAVVVPDTIAVVAAADCVALVILRAAAVHKAVAVIARACAAAAAVSVLPNTSSVYTQEILPTGDPSSLYWFGLV